jgi:hypothetical protein
VSVLVLTVTREDSSSMQASMQASVLNDCDAWRLAQWVNGLFTAGQSGVVQ